VAGERVTVELDNFRHDSSPVVKALWVNQHPGLVDYCFPGNG